MIRILVIEREFGAGAATIADLTARRLGWKLLDHALTEQIAQLAKISPEVCQHREERIDSWLYRLAKVFWRGSHERSVGFPDTDIVDADHLICLSQHVIENAAQEGLCVIVGRAAAYFLRERTDTFCVFLYASREFKYRRVLAEVKNEAEALKLTDTVDEERAAFIRHYYKVEWPSRHLYNAMLNTAIGDDATVDTILNLIDAANRREVERAKS
ncbi:MAG TPA: cytidylate kinase-like family protein [Verrucomicrobiae bacterium]|jgi:cytidylate kinase|nr:cytidylate kinase-like family protein [Verrucomicrobiae bacterium]